jgi:hypothetical protein
MPKGPNGQKRPADAIGLAVLVGKIATGEAEDSRDDLPKGSAKQSGTEGGKRRAASLSAERRTEIARRASSARWGGSVGDEKQISQTSNDSVSHSEERE